MSPKTSLICAMTLREKWMELSSSKIRDSYDIPVVYLTAYSDERTLKEQNYTTI